jgi:hypothetical protein
VNSLLYGSFGKILPITSEAYLPADVAAGLTEFARTCKAAARAVSLYPDGHPAIAQCLARLADATTRLTDRGPLTLQVHADALFLDGARPQKPDLAIIELAGLLHRHLIGGLTVDSGAAADSWRTLLILLSRPPEEVRADGGIAHLWGTAGGPSIDIQEIDYTEVLREKEGLAATIDKILAAAMAPSTGSGQAPSTGPGQLDDPALAPLADIVSEPGKIAELMKQLVDRAGQGARGTEMQTATFLRLVRGLVEYISRTAPEKLQATFEQLGESVRHMPVDTLVGLLAERNHPEAIAGAVNVVTSLVEHVPDGPAASFVASHVVAERGATERLAHAFQNLVPDFSRQRQLLALARDEAAASELGQDESFPELWNRVEGMLTSYSDSRYVSDDYARELSHVRTQPVGVEHTGDDPPDRIAAWLATVSDAALRNLDRDLLTDLLHIEMDPSRWRDVADTVVSHADDLVRVGYFDQAWHLIETLIAQGTQQEWRQEHANAALARFGDGSLLKHVSVHLRGAPDESFERLKRVCHAIGPSIIVPLAQVLAAEQDARSRRRLRDILVEFGPRGADTIRPLMNAANWEVRRTAAYLLREFGGSEGLKELVPLLADSEPLVQREAVQGLVLNGSEEASAILLKAVSGATGRTNDTLIKEVLGMREDRAASFFAYLVRHAEPGRLPALYVKAIEALGAAGDTDAVNALEIALNRGQWWSPFANRRHRRAAAQSLRRIGTPEALDALRDASRSGALGVRAAARAELARIE